MNTRVKKILKWFLGTVLGILLLITGSLYVLQDKICGVVVNELNAHLAAKVGVSKVSLSFWGSFPNLSVDFNDVYIQDSFSDSGPKDTLLYSERIRFKFNPLAIWKEDYTVKSIEISPGAIHIKVKPNGETNYAIFKESADTTATNFEFNLEKVLLDAVRFTFDNRATQQYYATHINALQLSGNFSESKFVLHAESNLQVKKARSGKVTLLSNKPAKFGIDILVDRESETFEIPSANLYVSNLPFQFSGKITPKDYQFEVHSKTIQLVDVANNFSVTELNTLRNFDGSGEVYFDLNVQGTNESTALTQIDCKFGVKNGSLTEPLKKLKIRGIQLTGKYSNRGGEDKELLQLSNIRFNTPGGPFSGNLQITKFKTPNYKGRATGNIHLAFLHALFPLPHVEKIQGNIGLKTNFNIQSVQLPNETMDIEIVRCEGEIELKQVGIQIVDDKRTFEQLNGVLYLRNDEAGMENVGLKVGKTDLQLQGVFRNIVPYFQNKGNLLAEVEIQSSYLDVEDLGTTSKEEIIQDGRKYILPDNIQATVLLQAKHIYHNTHNYYGLSSTMTVANRRIEFPNLEIQNAQAHIHGNFTIEERSPEIFQLTTQLAADNLDFKQLFREWNNFGQEVITENNIFGNAQAKVTIEAPIDYRTGIILPALKSQVYIKIDNGRLKNVEAFRSITESLKSPAAKLAIGKNNVQSLEKKLLDLRFETLENTFTIQNGQLLIPAMRIQNNALEIETTGKHSFDNSIDYRFAFRFRDLKEKNQNSEFGEEIDDGTGMVVYMRMHGNLDKPIIQWDKAAKKEQAKENRTIEKQTVKGMLKSEFGLFKGDSTVKGFQQKITPRETITLELEGSKTGEQSNAQKKQKESKLKNKLKNWKEEAEKSKEENFEWNE